MMSELLNSIVFFILAIGLLVCIHEFGHFWVARRLGVKVLRFSIGFGKPLLKKMGASGTEYVLAAIPLGGYVQMLGEQDHEITSANRHQAFNHQSLPVRTAIVMAGPLFNFIFAIIAYWLLFVVGIPSQIAMIGEIAPNSIASRAGLKPNEQIVQINHHKASTWTQANTALAKAVIDDNEVAIYTVTDRGQTRRYRLELNPSHHLLDEQGVVNNLGIAPWRPPVWIGKIVPDSPAEKAGFESGDKVVRMGEQAVTHWSQWVNYIRQRPGELIPVQIERAGQVLLLTVKPNPVIEQGKTIGRIGVGSFVPDEVRHQHQIKLSYGPLDSLAISAEKTWQLSMLMLKMFGKMLVGEASHKNISGPITIAQYAGNTAQLGWLEFVRFLALISISLGVINLLPIPMLDGGHLLYYAIEWVRGKPLSESAMAIGQRLGGLVIAFLIWLAFYNDLTRLFG